MNIKYPILAKSEREKIAAELCKISELPVKPFETFEQAFKKLKPEVQDRLLGPERAANFRAAGERLSDLTKGEVKPLECFREKND